MLKIKNPVNIDLVYPRLIISRGFAYNPRHGSSAYRAKCSGMRHDITGIRICLKLKTPSF